MKKQVYPGLVFLLFVVFAWLHFYKLGVTEFTGDEASPALLISEALKGLLSGDARFAAYPFLFYQEPLRGIFSGILLYLFGPGKVMMRLSNILFSLGSFWLLYWIFLKEKLSKTLIFLSLMIYSSAAVLMVSRLAVGMGRTNFLITLTGYWLYLAGKQKKPRYFIKSLWAFLFSWLTVVNASVYLVSLAVIGLRDRLFEDGAVRRNTMRVLGIMVGFSILWLGLPYLTYRVGFQEHFINRGMFYFLGRALESGGFEFLKSFEVLSFYTNYWLAWLILLSFGLAALIKELRGFLIISLPHLLALMMLPRPSYHALVYWSLFFLQLVLVVNWAWKRTGPKFLIMILFFILATLNLVNFKNNFLANSQGLKKDLRVGSIRSLSSGEMDEAVLRLYEDY